MIFEISFTLLLNGSFNSKVKSQKVFYHRDFTIIEAMIFEISLTSAIKSFILSFDTSTVSLIKHNQYLVSFADFRAMA